MSTPEIRNTLCYIIKHYGSEGLTVSIWREVVQDDVVVHIAFGNWRGSTIDLKKPSVNTEAAMLFADNYAKSFIEVMRLIKLHYAQYYFVVDTDGLMLTDVAVGPGPSNVKLCGPGMIRDIFGKLIRTQEVVLIEPIDDRSINAIVSGFGSYGGDLIIKPSKFKTVVRDKSVCPLYVEVRR